MCAQIEPVKWETLVRWMRVTAPLTPFPTNEVWPGRLAPVLIDADEPTLVYGCFGLMPHWAKPTLYRQTYNARTETVATKPTYRAAWKNRQFCAVPVTAFFEPNYETGRAVKHRIERIDGEAFWLAGLWECFRDNFDQDIWSFTLLTINAELHPLMSRYHGPDDEKRSVVVLPPEVVEPWISAGSDGSARGFLKHFPASDFVAAPARVA
ncbi:MAG TPA: SOS response-associated peptidase family protein [Cellvibrionaceae bacterium]